MHLEAQKTPMWMRAWGYVWAPSIKGEGIGTGGLTSVATRSVDRAVGGQEEGVVEVGRHGLAVGQGSAGSVGDDRHRTGDVGDVRADAGSELRRGEGRGGRRG